MEKSLRLFAASAAIEYNLTKEGRIMCDFFEDDFENDDFMDEDSFEDEYDADTEMDDPFDGDSDLDGEPDDAEFQLTCV